MTYLALKHIHITFAALSGVLFLVRGIWMLSGSQQLQRRWVKVVPHIVDTLLLVSAIGLVVWSSQYPGEQSWLTAKVVALVGYIALGIIALKRGRTKQVRVAAFVGALACYVYIVAVAVTKNPLV
ncbi:SirB2 family protein [Massilia sp. H6]|uniref:SirB2 family protein n=1 Tax=Massilia sp. H6 TaxID=2970464 RepID=UPI002169E2AA|nr:SirB2 family protein [Massilia sp. H6]UVW29344.1 SirB2 family protein [Massilia sp. H6]